MAKWGRKSWRFRPLSGIRFQFGSGRSFRRIKPVSWGSKSIRSSSAATSSPSPRWGARNWRSNRSTKRKPLVLGLSGGLSRGGRSGGLQGAGQRTRQPKPPIRKRTILLLIIAAMMMMSIPSFIFIEKNLRPPLMHIAKVRVKQVATQAINKAITEQVARNSDSEKLIDWKMNDDGRISGFMLNYGEHMKITSSTIETVQNTLTDLHNIPEHIPIGHALNSAIISSFGPRVPVRFEPVGAVKVELSTRQRDAGINMVLVEVYIRVLAEVTIIIPFDTEPELVETDIPISYLLVVGDVPMYYYDSKGNPVGESAPQAPNISVPLAPGAGVSTNQNQSDSQDSQH